MCKFALWVKIVKWVCVWGWNLKALCNRVLVSCLRVYCECVWVMYKQILSLFFLSALLSYSMFGWKWIQKLNFEYLSQIRINNRWGNETKGVRNLSVVSGLVFECWIMRSLLFLLLSFLLPFSFWDFLWVFFLLGVFAAFWVNFSRCCWNSSTIPNFCNERLLNMQRNKMQSKKSEVENEFLYFSLINFVLYILDTEG